MKSKYFIKKAVNGQFYFVLKARNGRTVLTSETYKSKRGCLTGIKSIQKNGATDIIIHQYK